MFLFLPFPCLPFLSGESELDLCIGATEARVVDRFDPVLDQRCTVNRLRFTPSIDPPSFFHLGPFLGSSKQFGIG
ncbi:hypothetical protein EDB85DRAFT_2006629 [Lactarius pseudohatsudake]|nr:hypothetical protein EDB85DRAFT_2006629 [Lactarius pseudohatsudake]